MTTEHDELERLVTADPVPTSAADIEAIRRAGGRIRARRRLVSGLAAAAVVGVLAVPAYFLGGGQEAQPPSGGFAGSPSAGAAMTGPTTEPTPSAPSPVVTGGRTHEVAPSITLSVEDLRAMERPMPACGVMACASARPDKRTIEHGEVVGARLPMGRFGDGQEVLYAARVDGVDLRTGEKARVTVVMAGLAEGQRLYRTVWAMQPGTEPGTRPLFLYGGTPLADSEGGQSRHYGVIGAVEGTHDVVEVSGPSGGPRAVSGLSHDVLPGWTVFFDTGEWDPGWDDGSATRAPLTYGVPGGPGCRLEECGMVG